MGYLKLGTLFAIAIAFGLALGATPQPATAQVAKKLKCKGCVKSKQIRNGQVKNADLGIDSVTGDKIAPDAVGSGEVVDNSLTRDDLAPDSVGSSELRDNAVSSDNVQDNSLTASDLATNSVGTDELQPDAVNSSKVANGSLTAIDLASPAGSDSVESEPILSLNGGVGIVVQEILVSVPGPGYLIVNASTNCLFDTDAARCACAISAVATLDSNQFTAQGDTGGIGTAASTRGFTVNNAGTATISLVCAEAGQARVSNRNMTAIYTPVRN